METPKVKGDSKASLPSGLWTKCQGCGTASVASEVVDNLYTCPQCGHHFRMPARERLAAIADAGTIEELAKGLAPGDPLEFVDSKAYGDRVVAARKKVGEEEAFVLGVGKIFGRPIVLGSFVFKFMGGSMGSVVGEKITRGFEYATEHELPIVVFHSSGGARMQEGILSLMQMPRTTVAVEMLKEAGLPYIVVLTHPTTGGVTASYAMLGDVQIAEPNALICFAGPRVIEQTIREQLPEGFQRAEYLLDHGMLDRVTPRTALRDELITIIRMLMDLPPQVMGDLPAPDKVAKTPETADEPDAAGPGETAGKK